MALTKVRYDMLDADVTAKITELGSPFVFEASQDGNVETLTKFKVGAVEKNIRSTAIAGQKLVITLASFTPNISVAGQSSLSWDQPATYFTVTVDNPTLDYPDEWISDVASIAASSGDITADLTKFNLTGAGLPLATSADFTATYTVKAGEGYIRPTRASVLNTNQGGSASAAVTVKNDTATGDPQTWPTTYTWTTSWQSVSHSISIANLSNYTFLKKYTSTTYSVGSSGLSNAANVAHTVTGTNGSLSSDSGSGTITFTTPIHKDNTGTTTKVALSSVFTRPESVMGAGQSYTYSPTNLEAAFSASFTYPSITLMTDAGTPPSLGDVIDDSQPNGFKSTVTVLNHHQNSYPLQAVTNNTGATRVFWFGVRTSGVSQPTSFKSGDATYQFDVSNSTATLNLKPTDTSSFAGTYNAVGYTFYGINVGANTTLYIVIS